MLFCAAFYGSRTDHLSSLCPTSVVSPKVPGDRCPFQNGSFPHHCHLTTPCSHFLIPQGLGLWLGYAQAVVVAIIALKKLGLELTQLLKSIPIQSSHPQEKGNRLSTQFFNCELVVVQILIQNFITYKCNIKLVSAETPTLNE